jgi:ketosteroid isomerase-like protein
VSQENLEIVLRCYEFINSIGRTDEFVDPEHAAPDLWERVAPDFVLHDRPDLPDAKAYRGRDESKEFWRKTQELFAELHWEPREIIDLGDVVVVETRIVALGRGSELRIEADETDVFWFRDGLMVRLQGFPTRDEALEAAHSDDYGAAL